MSHSSENCFGKRFNQNSIKETLGQALGNRDDSVKNYKKSEHKWKRELKSLNNQNKMLYSIAKKSGSSRELKNIKKIKAKASKKCSYSISGSSISDSDSDYSLSSDSNREEER